MISFVSLSSGSNGNCYYLGNEEIAFLIDVGIGPRTIKKRLKENGLTIDRVAFILVTHDHIDHIKHLGSIASRLKLPVLATQSVHDSLLNHPCTRGMLKGLRRDILPGIPFMVGEIEITAFTVPHDATETVGYHINFFGELFTVITDIGSITEEVVMYSRMANHLVIEANYDYNMLVEGDYPPYLIERIRGGNGHLSNEETALAMREIYHPGLKNVFMCHLSENNNNPDLVYRAVYDSLNQIGIHIEGSLNIKCLPRRSSYICEI